MARRMAETLTKLLVIRLLQIKHHDFLQRRNDDFLDHLKIVCNNDLNSYLVVFNVNNELPDDDSAEDGEQILEELSNFFVSFFNTPTNNGRLFEIICFAYPRVVFRMNQQGWLQLNTLVESLDAPADVQP